MIQSALICILFMFVISATTLQKPNQSENYAQWRTLDSAFWKLRQEHDKFEGCLCCRVSSRPAWANSEILSPSKTMKELLEHQKCSMWDCLPRGGVNSLPTN